VSDLALFFLVFFCLLLMLVGLAGMIVPVLPGLVLVWLGALIYGLVAGFGQWGPWLFAVITILAIAGYGLDLLLTHLGALKTGASWQALLASLVLGTVGFFVVPVIGALIGALLGLFLVEYHRRKDAAEAWQATRGALVGFALGFGLQITFGLTMIGLWIVWVWLG
jgi:uncharacterized protein YqgC (DUF456 family)